MAVHLVNPSHWSFGIGVISTRWPLVLAPAAPTSLGTHRLLMRHSSLLICGRFNLAMSSASADRPRNALRGYEIGTLARARGATVGFGGVHATRSPDEAPLGGAHGVVKGDGDIAWPLVLPALQRSGSPAMSGSLSRHRSWPPEG
jgi:hypothetical protein